jgi:hypothetical protein
MRKKEIFALICMGNLFFVNAYGKEELIATYVYGTESANTYLDGCFLITKIRRPEKNYNSTSKSLVTDITCEAEERFNSREVVELRSKVYFSCITANKAQTVEVIDEKNGNIEKYYAWAHSFVQVPNKTGFSTKLTNKLSSLKSKCRNVENNVTESNPPGKFVSIMKWENGRQGYSGVITSVVTTNSQYNIRVTDIIDGGYHLNPGLCSENLSLQKGKDEGRILNVPALCLKDGW